MENGLELDYCSFSDLKFSFQGLSSPVFRFSARGCQSERAREKPILCIKCFSFFQCNVKKGQYTIPIKLIISLDTGGSRLMRISLVRISLLGFFKTFHKYLTNANFGLFISLVQFFGQNIWLMRIFGLFISLLRFALC